MYVDVLYVCLGGWLYFFCPTYAYALHHQTNGVRLGAAGVSFYARSHYGSVLLETMAWKKMKGSDVQCRAAEKAFNVHKSRKLKCWCEKFRIFSIALFILLMVIARMDRHRFQTSGPMRYVAIYHAKNTPLRNCGKKASRAVLGCVAGRCCIFVCAMDLSLKSCL